MALMNIRLELGRTRTSPDGDPRRGYEFIAPLDDDGHLDAAVWRLEETNCWVRSFWPDRPDRKGWFRHVGRGWRFEYPSQDQSGQEPIFKLDRHVLSPGFCVTLTEDDGAQLPFKIASVFPAKISA